MEPDNISKALEHEIERVKNLTLETSQLINTLRQQTAADTIITPALPAMKVKRQSNRLCKVWIHFDLYKEGENLISARYLSAGAAVE